MMAWTSALLSSTPWSVVFGRWSVCPFRSKLLCQFQPRVKQIFREHFHSLQGQQMGKLKPYRPLAGDQDGIAWQNGQPFDGFQHGVNGLDHRPLQKRIARRDFHHARKNEWHHANKFGITATGGLEPGGNTGLLILSALREGAVAAGMASQARHVMMQSDPVADPES